MPQNTLWSQQLSEASRLLETVRSDRDFLTRCGRFSDALIQTVNSGGNLFACGNGGSHCDAMHFAEELTGRFDQERAPIGALALGDPSHTTCVGNDYGFDQVFARQLLALGRPGDLLIGLSTSGKSKNLLEAFRAAHSKGIRTFALLGRDGGALKDLAQDYVLVPHQDSGRIQEIHIKLIHIAIQNLEAALVQNA